jgi:hypothetical protein
MMFPLSQIIQSHDLSHLDEPFTMEEINAVELLDQMVSMDYS